MCAFSGIYTRNASDTENIEKYNIIRIHSGFSSHCYGVLQVFVDLNHLVVAISVEMFHSARLLS